MSPDLEWHYSHPPSDTQTYRDESGEVELTIKRELLVGLLGRRPRRMRVVFEEVPDEQTGGSR